MAKSIGQYVAEFIANMDGFLAPIKDAQREADQMEKRLKPLKDTLSDVGSVMTGVGAAISAVGVPFAIAAKHSIDLADSLNEISERTGASVEALSAIKVQAELSGASIETVEKAFRASSKVMEDAATGSKAAAESIEKIGLSTATLLAMTPDERFFAIATALNGISDPGLKAAAAMELYGRSGTDLIPILDELAKGQEHVKTEAAAVGQLISTQTAKSADEFNDSLKRLADALTGVVNAMITSGLLDKLTDLANRTATFISEFATAHPNIVAVGGAIGALAAVIGPLVAGIGLIISGISGLIPLFTSLLSLVGGTAGISSALSALGAVLSGPVGIAVAIIAVTAALTKFVMSNETLVKILDPIWTAIGNAINATINFIIKLWGDMWNFILDAPKRAKDAILGAVKGVTDSVTGFFKDMYTKVVGQSFVPDMIARIEQEFNRLPSIMNNPTSQAVGGVIGQFQKMMGEIASIVGGLTGGGGGGGFFGALKSIVGIAGSFIPGIGPFVGLASAFLGGAQTGYNAVKSFQGNSPNYSGGGNYQNYQYSNPFPTNGTTVNVNVGGHIVGVTDLARVLVDEIYKLSRNGGYQVTE
jgi:Flp pilus assembly pilin Flp